MANAIRKRIALAAAVAVAGGLLSAVPAQAATVDADGTRPFVVTAAEYVANSDGVVISATDRTGGNEKTDSVLSVVHNASNALNFVELTAGANAAPATGSFAAARVEVTGSTLTIVSDGAGTATLNSGRTVATWDTSTIDTSVVRISTAAAGTITAKVIGTAISNGQATDTTLQTITITVNATKTVGVISTANSSIIRDTDTTFGSADATVLANNDQSANSAVEAFIKVSLLDANKVAVTDETITATVTSGPGLIIAGDGLSGGALTNQTSAGKTVSINDDNNAGGTGDGVYYFAMRSDGTRLGGSATVSFSVGTTVVGTETIAFYGKAASLEAKVLAVAANSGNTAAAIWVVAKDAQGNIVPAQNLTVTSKSAALLTDKSGQVSATAAQAAAATGTVEVTAASGATFGTATLEIALAADSTVKTSVQVQVSEKVADKATVTFDKATYAPGEKVVMTVSLVDDNGAPVADTFAGQVTYSANMAVTPAFATSAATITETLGKATVEFFAPATSGTVNVIATFASDSGNYSTNLAGKTATGSFVVATAGAADLAAIKADLAKLQKDTMDLIAALSAQISYLRKQLNQLLRRR